MMSFIIYASLSLVVAALAAGSTRDGKSRTPLIEDRLESSADTIPYKTLSHGQSSSFGGKLTATFDNAGDFAEFWAKHTSGPFPPEPAPDVDFSKDIVAAIFWGQKHSWGYVLDVTSIDWIDPNDFEVAINYDLSCPIGMVGAAISQPHQIIQFAKAGRVGFKPNYKATPLHFMINMKNGDQAEADRVASEAEADRVASEVNRLEGVYDPVGASCFFSWGRCMIEGYMDSTTYTEAEARDLLEGIAGDTVSVHGGGDCDADSGFDDSTDDGDLPPPTMDIDSEDLALDVLRTPQSGDIPMEYETLGMGSESGVTGRLLTTFDNAQDFESFWAEHTSNTNDPLPLPNVDFRSEMVAALFWGQRTSDGFFLGVTSVSLTDSNDPEATISYNLECAGGTADTILTQPHQIVKFSYASRVKFNPTYVQYPIGFFLEFDTTDEDELGRIYDEIESLPGLVELDSKWFCHEGYDSCEVHGGLDVAMYGTSEARELLEGVNDGDVNIMEIFHGIPCDESTGEDLPPPSLSLETDATGRGRLGGGPVMATYKKE